MSHKQRTSRVLMVRPIRFCCNPQTADNNAFQVPGQNESIATINAQREFDDYVHLLRTAGIDVTVIQDSPEPHTPDSLFPNNWFSTHESGELIFYPMHAPNRQREFKPGVLKILESLPYKEIIDFRPYIRQGLALEGTGCLIMDRIHNIVYCCASVRAAKPVLDDFCRRLKCDSIYFHSFDKNGVPIYHTNVMMCLGTKYAVICLESITNKNERSEVVRSLERTGHEIVDISLDQVCQFAGNMLELEDKNGQSYIVMSRSAYNSLTANQLGQIRAYSKIIAPDLSTIERNGGGSARCMIAELYI